MRSEAEIMDLIFSMAKFDERIRLVTLVGSRADLTVPRDDFQDYDIGFLVTDMESFKADDTWLDHFGPRLMMQKPEAMSLFPPELGNWFTYLMLFEDGSCIDLMLVPADELPQYLKENKIVQILMDKDNRVPMPPPANTEAYLVKKPTSQDFDDCQNEFWWLSTYVAKGLCRREIFYALEHLHLLRHCLLIMLAWKAAAPSGFTITTGKAHKYLDKYIDVPILRRLLATYRNGSPAEVWRALFDCMALFRETAQSMAETFNYPYPDYDEKITPYLLRLHNENRP